MKIGQDTRFGEISSELAKNSTRSSEILSDLAKI